DVSACSDVNKITSCVAGKKTIVGTACTPSGQRGSSDYTVDNSQLGSLEIMSQADLEQSGFLGVGALGLISASEASSHFTNASGVLNSQAVASVPIQFIKYRTDAIYPLLVSGLEVRVGNTLALVPLEAPVPATCYISAVDQVSGGQSVGFTMHGTGVISSAELNGGSISLPLQSSDPGTRVLSTLSLVAPSSPGQLTNLVQEANSDYANGQWTISGRVVGPKNDGNFTCSKVVQVRVYNPKAPECGLAISPDTQEPDEPVSVTVTAKNSVTSAVLNGSIPITFSPAPSASTTGTFSTTRIKNGSGEETFSAVLTGPGGTTTCTKQLFPKVPLPPICQLAANPTQIQSGQSTTLTLTTQNRVDSATIAGQTVLLSARWNGTGTMTYSKTTPNSEQIQAVVSSRGMSSTCSVNLACAPSPAPRCSLVVAPQKVKPGERATVTLSCQDPVASASIAGSPVSLSGGTASISYTKNGLNP
ncbi:hypothetical protein EBQ90_12670, partial [bacterium]|nr:hypothetical protein [bacterium]